MAVSTHPFLAVYIAWHPTFDAGAPIAKRLYDHFRRELYENVAGGTGLSVLYRSDAAPGASAPQPINFSDSETAAVIVLVDEHLVADNDYMAWVKAVTNEAEVVGLGTRVFPVAIDSALTRVGVAEQAVRWDKWDTSTHEQKVIRLVSDLTYQFCRMLRLYLERLRRPVEEEQALLRYLKKVQIFLSHSKRDLDGERIAKAIREYIFRGDGLSTFFDVHDIPSGVRFNVALLSQVRVSAIIAVYTDSFSSREWCRREIIEAKRHNAPLVVANCISDIDERGFPYMGNVPIVRMDPKLVDRIDLVIARLLDEVLKDFLWRCRVALAAGTLPERTFFLPRPPELISLVNLPYDEKGITIVYPDPPLGAEEQSLFEKVAPAVQLRSWTEWVARMGI